LIDDGATASIQQEVVGLIPAARAFENFGGHKGAGFRVCHEGFVVQALRLGGNRSIRWQ
jgi:hypothetical protein